MRIAYFSPLSPQRTGVADYSEELLPYLARHAELDLFVDAYTPANPDIAARFPVHDYRELESLRQARRYDVALYQMGNSRYHEYVYRTLARFPGVTVLHDHVLHHLVVEMTVGRGDEAAYIREMGYCHGVAGIEAAWEALRAGYQFPYLRYPANRRVLDSSFGVIVHSRYAQALLAAESPHTPVALVPHHVLPAEPPEDLACLRRSLGLPEEALLFASFGLATPEKRLDVALRAFRQVRERFPDALYLVVGDVPARHDLPQTIHDLGLRDSATVTGYVAKSDLLRYVDAVDVCVSLRWPTVGETSGSLLRALVAGKAAIVSDVGSFAELPDDCCRKVPVGEAEHERLVEAMLALAEDPAGREALGQRARRHVLERHAIERSAAQYIAFVESLLG